VVKYNAIAEKLKSKQPDSSIYWYTASLKLFEGKNLTAGQKRILADALLGIGNAYCNTGSYEKAFAHDSMAMQIGLDEHYKDILAKANNGIGLIFYNTGEFDSALVYYNKAEVLGKEANDQRTLAKVYTNTAIIKFLQGSVKLAAESFAKTLEIANRLNDSELQAGTYNNLALIYSEAGNYDKGIENYQNALAIYTKENAKDGIMLCNQNLGAVYFLTCDFNKALDAFNLSLKLAIEINDKSNTAKAYHNLGEIYARLGDFKTAVEYYLNSITIKEQINFKQGLSADYFSLGEIAVHQSEYNKAIAYYEKALKVDNELDYKKGIASGYSNLANVYGLQNNVNKAIGYYTKALEINKSIENKSAISDNYLGLAGIYRQKKDYKSALYNYKLSLNLKQQLGDDEGNALIYNDMAELYMNMAEKQISGNSVQLLNTAIEYGLKSYRIASELKTLPIINNASATLKKAYSKIGKKDEALKYADKYIATNDSLFNKSKTEAITNAEARWNSEKKQRTIDNFENQNKLQQEIINRKEAETKRQKIVIYTIIVVFILLVITGLFVVLYFRKRRQVHYQQQLQSIASLKMQNARNRMSPHFLFNLLSSISASTDKPEVVKSKLDNISLLLRKTLENVEKTTISLNEELDIVKNFIALRREKIPEPFCVDYKIDSNADLSIQIPAMIIQIPVENALKHGLMPLGDKPKNLTLAVRKTADNHIIEVIDNGVGLKASEGRTTGTGTGLKVLMQTIHLLNSKNKYPIKLNINSEYNSDNEEVGTRVEIVIPLNFNYSF
jgi:tetratricopeptide (TPR) repeat protein